MMTKKQTDKLIKKLIADLTGKGWMTAAELGATKEADKRDMRAAAGAARGRIMGGQNGYKLTAEATKSDLKSMNWFKVQAQQMFARFYEIHAEYLHSK